MTTLLSLLLAALLGWKLYFAWRRGRGCYRRERTQYQTLWEYMVANGTPPAQASRYFLRRALRRALLPWLRQWRSWLAVAATAAALLAAS